MGRDGGWLFQERVLAGQNGKKYPTGKTRLRPPQGRGLVAGSDDQAQEACWRRWFGLGEGGMRIGPG